VISFTAAKGTVDCLEIPAEIHSATSFWVPNPDLRMETTNVRNSAKVGFAIDAIPEAAEWNCRHGNCDAEMISKLSSRKSVN